MSLTLLERLVANPPPPRYVCQSCKELILGATRIDCTHQCEVCEGCASESLSRNICLSCHHDLCSDQLEAVRPLRETLDRLDVCCRNAPACSSIHTLGEDEWHWATQCSERLVKCEPGCGEMIHDSRLAIHRRRDCSCRLMLCPIGGAACYRVPFNLLELHVAGCNKYICLNAHDGCLFRGTAQDVNTHEDYCMKKSQEIAKLKIKCLELEREQEAMAAAACDEGRDAEFEHYASEVTWENKVKELQELLDASNRRVEELETLFKENSPERSVTVQPSSPKTYTSSSSDEVEVLQSQAGTTSAHSSSRRSRSLSPGHPTRDLRGRKIDLNPSQNSTLAPKRRKVDEDVLATRSNTR